MKLVRTTLMFICFASFLAATTCNDDTTSGGNCEDTLQELQLLEADIRALVNASVCTENTECRFIAFGAKACGGPKEYLIYSTSINTLQLQQMVENYNQKENQYNIDCDIVSDCLFVSPPNAVDCVDGQCTVVE